MTVEETDAQIIETVKELSKSRARQTELMAKAECFQSEVYAAQGLLQEVTSGSRSYSHGGGSPTENGWPSHNDLMALSIEMSTTRNRIEELTERCRQWNIMD